MRWFKNLLVALAIIALVGVSALLLMDNSTPLSLRFLNVQTPAIPVFWWLLMALVIGVCLGAGLSAIGFIRIKFKERQLRRELDQNKEELHRIRTMTLHD